MTISRRILCILIFCAALGYVLLICFSLRLPTWPVAKPVSDMAAVRVPREQFPSQAALTKFFHAHQADLEQLRKMFQADRLMHDVYRYETATYPVNDSQEERWRFLPTPASFTPARWDAYRRLFRRLDVKGISRLSSGELIIDMAWFEVAHGAYGTGLVYRTTKPSRLVSSLVPDESEDYMQVVDSMECAALGKGWYVYLAYSRKNSPLGPN